jgi:predicted dehydrogenase
MKKLRIGVVGFGNFARCFIPLYQAHPLVSGVDLAEIREDRRAEGAAAYRFGEVYNDFESLLKGPCDAVAIFTDRSRHFPFAKAALLAGKHVYCAVPMANRMEEIAELVDLVKRTGLTYMMGETSVYYPAFLYCRKKWQLGAFGRFVYGEGEYLHDMAEPWCSFYEIYRNGHGDQWRKFAGLPPMHYPTHSVSMVLGITGARMTSVSCIGLDDTAHPDECWGRGRNFWDNPFSSQSALFRTSDGGMARINEFRRVGVCRTNSVRLSLFGTEAVFEEQSGDSSGVCTFSDRLGRVEDPMPLIRCAPGVEARPGHKEYIGTALVHDVARLPESYMGLGNGHFGAHQFLTDDFIKSCVFGKVPSVSAWEAAKFTAPGLVAHESSLRDGERLPVPDFGEPLGDRVDPWRWA